MKLLVAFILFLFTAEITIGQDSTISQAVKSNRSKSIYPLIKAKAPSYPLMTAYLIQKYASDGDPLAQHELGLRYLLGKGFSKDTAKAIRWIKMASDKNLTAAKYNYSIMLENGIGVEWNPFEAFSNVKFAAENGMPEAQFFYGVFFTDNLVVNRNYNEAYNWFNKAASANFEPALKAKKQMEESGLVVTNSASDGQQGNKQYQADSSVIGSSALFNPEYELDFFEFEKTLDSGKTDLSKIYNQDFNKLKENLGVNEIPATQLQDSSGQSLVKFAAEQGSPEGLLIVGKDYEQGVSFDENITKAVESFIKAYRLGSIKALQNILKIAKTEEFYNQLQREVNSNIPAAMYVWAGLTALGIDYQLTNEQALELLEKAAEQNHINAIIEKGLCYYNGTLVEKNRDRALEYWQKASALGSSEARIRIAFMILLDNRNEDEYKKALRTLLDATAQGSVLAQTALAYCYENGIFVKKDKATAARLYRSASHRGSEVAYNSLRRMYDGIRPDAEEFIIVDQI
ncbi:MAG: sel1 repeat family protein [Melioribacteraceae bacterium]|nr:sel1 repeat family protein [Melioribacteraceae bacterium]